ncbi:MAG: cytochrome c [Woeseiaceae bacterium]|nr:cytochrome c [Woeseiaceae bacterium]
MKKGLIALFLLLIAACAAEETYDPLEEYEELDPTTVIGAPDARPGAVAPDDRDMVERGQYLVQLLGCGACHTDGALTGAPNPERLLAGSRVGIAYTSPLENRNPGVIYPANITPDMETGIGNWSNQQIANAIRAGVGSHGGGRIETMPWQGYALLTDDDVDSIVAYLRSIPPVEHSVPRQVRPGQRARENFVYFGVYWSND